MDFTSPQRFLLEAKDLNDYQLDILHKPAALERIVNQASKAGLSKSDLKSLYGFAHKKGLIDLSAFKFYTGKLDLQRKRTERITGKIDPRDIAISDEDDERTVICVNPSCKKRVSPTKARLTSSGWACENCLGRAQPNVSPAQTGVRTVNL